MAGLLRGKPAVGGLEQAFPLLTVDDNGFPHVCLLSRAELQPARDEVRAVIAGSGTRRNLERDGKAMLMAADGEAAHYLVLEAVRRLEGESALAVAFRVVDHIVDSAGVPLEGMRFVVGAHLPVSEAWGLSTRLLAALARHRVT